MSAPGRSCDDAGSVDAGRVDERSAGAAEAGSAADEASETPGLSNHSPLVTGAGVAVPVASLPQESAAPGARTAGLVLVGTPLGRLSDASSGLRRVLADADVVAAEDTRRLRRLAADLGVELRGAVISYYEAVEEQRIPALVQRVADGEMVALVTDAGMPSVSDPGYRLVAAVAAAGLHVTSVPGPSAVITAVALSGLPSDRFTFEGFLPRKAGERRRALVALAAERRTMVFFESVHRISEALTAMAAVFGANRRAAVCRELTKTYEEIRRGTLAELVAWAAGGLRGELTVVVAGATAEPVAGAPTDLASSVNALVAQGSSRRDAVDEVAARTGLSRREVYAAAVDRAAEEGGKPAGPLP